MRRQTLTGLCLIGLIVTGCATVQQPPDELRTKAMQTVIAATDVYDILMISLGSLYQAKLLGATVEENNRNRDSAVHLANTYRAAALKVASGVQGEEFERAISTMQGAITMLRAIMQQWSTPALNEMQREVDGLVLARLEQ